MKAEPISTATVTERPDSPAPTCRLCGGPIKSHNKYGICNRKPVCQRKAHARSYAANREKVNARCRRYYAANREKICEQKHRYRAANHNEIKERCCRYNAANREKNKERGRRYHAANREKLNERKRLYRTANREIVNDQQRRSCAKRQRRNPLSCMPQGRRRGHLNTRWQGGEMMYCSAPGCHRMAGWKTPSQIKKIKTGFRCPEHRNVRLPPIKEEDYEYQKIRSSVA